MAGITLLLIAGLLVAAFVGYNIGGSSTGVAFGPAVGSQIVGKPLAAGLFTLFALWGGWTVGRHVIETMSEGIVPASQFTLAVSIVVLFFAGGALLISNFFGVPSSTSMTAVGAIAGLGLATDTLNEQIMFGIVSAWIVAPLIALWSGVLIGRYIYPYLDARVTFTRFEGGLYYFDRSGSIPRPRLNQNATFRDLLGAVVVLAVSCYNAFSAGASNAANAIAPLVGSGSITASQGILLAIAAIGIGGFTIARRTLDTIGEGITDLPILAALIVSLVGATIITILSNLGVPASLAVSMTSCIIGLGWGRSSRTVTIPEAAEAAIEGEGGPDLNVGALATGREADSGITPGPTIGEVASGEAEARQPPSETSQEHVPPIGEPGRNEVEEAPELFDRSATGRVVFLWLLTPTLSTIGSYLVFSIFL
ncbi:inorganic phosphate transporter [Halococcus sp. IIIV-5B]|uniref:inorganic phosphate transporter n=1 Tax=Halococcus sp. IIIV-5B TaxID=2321230 RepID=UPI000E73F997|nr:inorganic phosphate transporter [Halococcus sp. IIIV-5B]RJT07069.1 anion permease [Halococcus sp. IIIV-5B]